MDKPNEAAANYELERSARHDVMRPEFSAKGAQVVISDDRGVIGVVADCGFEADADFIARACNAHDDLVKALRDLCNAVDSCVDLTPEVMAQARAALVKAGA